MTKSRNIQKNGKIFLYSVYWLVTLIKPKMHHHLNHVDSATQIKGGILRSGTSLNFNSELLLIYSWSVNLVNLRSFKVLHGFYRVKRKLMATFFYLEHRPRHAQIAKLCMRLKIKFLNIKLGCYWFSLISIATTLNSESSTE